MIQLLFWGFVSADIKYFSKVFSILDNYISESLLAK